MFEILEFVVLSSSIKNMKYSNTLRRCHLTHLCPVDYSTSLFGQVRFLFLGVSSLILVLSLIIENFVFNANSIDPDQTPQNAASDLSLHCLPICNL